jgi:hypothetical protein
MTNFKYTRLLSALAVAGAVTAGMASTLSEPASAAIRCEGNFQITKHGRIATPYCEDNYLGRVAREHGMRVSNRAIRYNPSVKERVCLLVGQDIRVKNTCAPYLPDRGRSWR